ncbi:hypothetical protein Bra3105_18430 (plasmid) [Brachybacterium halotolerans subsp. kimchii]|uniref:hypothetical protein n=1 Tax=Brachybacterium halotolerans TaxID=2795215 RepID=UPI001E5A1E97|nr:hypothetical protein [Brachybacterium halotolerans]UEJ84609.1 hypothetical protein Bra3105_18430 [Brachybacterium halotolerans subsp. kimchii]
MSSNDDQTPNPFTRPSFMLAGAVVTVLVVVAVVLAVLAIRDGGRDEPTASTPPSTTTAPSTSSSTPANADASICGLPGEVTSGTVKKAPGAKWKYEGTVAYPTSAKYGPGQTTDDGVRSCFQHSPEGALFAAANSVAVSEDPEAMRAWAEYFVADSPAKDALLSEESVDSTGEGRLRLVGYRMLDYDGRSASVDMATEVTTNGQKTYVSFVYDLVWEDGDWKLKLDSTDNPLQAAAITSLDGYTEWGE